MDNTPPKPLDVATDKEDLGFLIAFGVLMALVVALMFLTFAAALLGA